MKLKVLFAVIAFTAGIILLSNTNTYGQFLSDSTVNYFTLTEYYDAYYDSIFQLRGVDSMHGTGYSDYLRWKYFYSNRYGRYGDLTGIWSGIDDYLRDLQEQAGYVDISDWKYMGPMGIPLGPNGTSRGQTGKGMMISIWIDPIDHDHILAGGHHGGLWKTTDGGKNWYPLNDEDHFLHGINSIAVDPRDNDIIYITGTSKLSFVSSYSAGLFRSTDGGSSWDFINTIPGTNYPSGNSNEENRKIMFHPNHPDTLMFINARSLCLSVDEGETWDQLFHKNYVWWDSDTDDFFYNQNGLFDIAVSTLFDSVIYIAGSEIFQVHLKGGEGYDTVNISNPVFLAGLAQGDELLRPPGRTTISVNDNFPGMVWFCFSSDYTINGQDKKIFRVVRFSEIDSSYTFLFDYPYNESNSPKVDAGKLVFSVSPSDDSVFYIGGIFIDRLKLSSIEDTLSRIGGSEYPDSTFIHMDMRAMEVLSDGMGNDTLYIANDGGIAWGTMFGSIPGPEDNYWHWRQACGGNINGLDVTEFYGIGLSESEDCLIAGGCQDLSYMMLDGDNWVNFGIGDGCDAIFDPIHPDTLYYFEWQSGLYIRSKDRGATKKHFYAAHSGIHYVMTPMILDIFDRSILYGGSLGLLLRFSDVNNFQSNPVIDTIIEFLYAISDIELADRGNNQKRMYVSTSKAYHSYNNPPPSSSFDNCIFRSDNNGTTFTDISMGLDGCRDGFVCDIEVNPNNYQELWVACALFSEEEDELEKVYYSEDGGNHWSHYSDGLPDGMPVYNVKYVPVINSLFAATDIGIFIRGTQDTTWFLYNNNLPKKIITDLEINTRTNKIYASTYGRGLWESPVYCNYIDTPLIITQDMIWIHDTILDRSIVIEEDNTLTIRDCNVFLPTGAKIVVQRGAKLVLDSCILTGACHDLWRGIEVWGDSKSMQAANIQGVVELKNHAVVEQAHKAVFCGKNIEDYYPDWDYTGGIIDAEDAIFRNNRYGAMLWTYPENSSSRFSGCKFQTTKILANGSLPEYFMSLVQVHGVVLEECDFEYLIDDEQNMREQGRGIFSIDAGYEIKPKQEGIRSANFNNLEYGIFALKRFEDQPVLIHHAYFGKNLTGIYASGVETLELFLNDFFVYTDSLPPGSQVYGGIYLDHCSGFFIEENYFFGSLLTHGDMTNIGITINDSGEEYNEIYKNTFEYLDIGTLAQNYNRSEEYDAGLKLRCNVYNQNNYDIAVTGYPECDECGIALYQGSSSNPAGNLFSQVGDHPTSDFDNQQNNVIYYHHKYLSGQDTADQPWIPMYYSENVLLTNTQMIYSDTTCSSHLGSIRDLQTQQSSIFTAGDNSDSLTTELMQLTDGGSTIDLEADIILAQPDEALELKDQLLSESPYLSDTILIRSVEREEVLVPAMITELMIANPQGAKSDLVMNAIESRENPIPDYMMSDILTGKDSVAGKENLEAGLSFWNSQKEFALNRLINIFRIDSSGAQYDSIIDLLQDQNSLYSKYRLMFAYFENEDTANAQLILNQIPQEYSLTASQALAHQHWMELLGLHIDLQRDSLTLNELDSNQLATVLEIATYENLPGCLARNVLHYLDVEETGPYYILPEDLTKHIPSKKEEKGPVTCDPAPVFKVYPNPSRDYLIIEYDLDGNSNQGILAVFSSDGKMKTQYILPGNRHLEFLSTRNWENGIYFINFITGDSKIYSAKILVLK